MTQTIEQLTAKVAELEEENARLNLLFVKAAKGKGENLKECFSLQQQLAEKDEVIAEAGEMLAMRDRQLAALKAENERQPISTAPKDEAVFLVWRKPRYISAKG